MVANTAGDIVRHAWEELPQRFPGIGVDVAVVMPNHFHGIIIVGAQFIAPSSSPVAPNCSLRPMPERPVARIWGVMNHAPTLGKIVRAFKAVSTRRIRTSVNVGFAWQRNYYERVIRNEAELHAIREYIADNPRQWAMDRENPEIG
jgi:REP element-mobilizing transposase RayT